MLRVDVAGIGADRRRRTSRRPAAHRRSVRRSVAAGCRAGCRPATPGPASRPRRRRRARARRLPGARPRRGRRRSPAGALRRRRTPARRRGGEIVVAEPERAQRRRPAGATSPVSQRAAAGCVREARVTAFERVAPGADVVREGERGERRGRARACTSRCASTRHGALQRSGSAEKQEGRESRARRTTADATKQQDRRARGPPPRSDGSAACVNDPLPVTKRRMKAASSGAALSPTTCKRDAGTPVGDRHLADAVDVAVVVVEVADEQHGRVARAGSRPDHVEREREPGRDPRARRERVRPRAARRLRQRAGARCSGTSKKRCSGFSSRAGVFGGSA